MAHSVVMEPPARAPRDPRERQESDWREVQPEDLEPPPPPPDTPLHGFPQLDRFLGSRLLRLEVTGDDPVALADAQRVREGLAKAGACAAEAVPGSPSFESALGETVRGVYAWVFGALDALFLGDSVRPLPRRLADALAEHAEVCAMRATMEAQGGRRTATSSGLGALEAPLASLRAGAVRLGRARA